MFEGGLRPDSDFRCYVCGKQTASAHIDSTKTRCPEHCVGHVWCLNPLTKDYYCLNCDGQQSTLLR